MLLRTNAKISIGVFSLIVLVVASPAFAASKKNEKTYKTKNAILLQIELPNILSSSSSTSSSSTTNAIGDAQVATSSDTLPDTATDTVTLPAPVPLPVFEPSPKPIEISPSHKTPTATTSPAIVLPTSGSGVTGNVYASGLLSPAQSRNLFLLAFLSGSFGLLLAEGTLLARFGRALARIFGSKPTAVSRSRA